MGLLDSIGSVLNGVFGEILGSLFDFPEQKEKGVTVERQGSDNSIPVLYGTRKLGAIKVHKYVSDTTFGAWNDLLHIICVFAEGEVDGLETLYFNGVESTDPKFTGGKLNGNKWFSCDFYNGAEGQPASAAAVSGIPNWTIDHKLDGLCYAYIVLQMPGQDEDVRVWSGEPEIQATIRGKKVLDTRTGITAYSENPAMCLRDYLTNPIYGKGLPQSFVNDGSFELVANACDEGVDSTITKTVYSVDRSNTGYPTAVASTSTSTVTLPRFTCNLIVDTNEDFISNVKEILSSFRGIVQDLTGSAKITYETTMLEQYGVDDTAFHFTADDIVGGMDHDGGTIDQRYNSFEVRFPNKEKDYETDSVFYPEDDNPLRAQWLEEDGGKDQPGSIEFDSITSKAEALQLAEILAKRSRFTRTSQWTGMPWTIAVEVGDVVGIDSQMNGWTNKPFRITEKKLNDDDTVDFTGTEHEDAVYPWSGRSFDELVGGTWLGDPDDIPPVTGLTIVPDLTLSRTGTLKWQTPANAWVRRYEVVIKDSGDDIIFDVDVLGNAYDVPLLDAGSYTAYVYSISQTGARSPSAAIGFSLTSPVAPTSIDIESRDWEIEAAPQLAGIGLGTVFEFDITIGDGTGYTPTSKARSTTYTFTGLLPDTLHTVYARSVNAYGTSGWTSVQATTTNTGAQIGELLDPIREELDQYSPMTVPTLPLMADDFAAVFGDWQNNEALNNERTKTDIIAGKLDDPQNNTSAMYSLVQQAQTKADGSVSAVNALDARVTTNEQFASSQLILNSEYDAELDTLSARAFLGTNVNDRVTGIVIGDSGSEQSIDFLSDSVRFFDNNGDAQIYFDVANNRYVFSGEIIANAGTFTGTVSGSTINGSSINGGSITGATVTGSEIRTAASGSRTILEDDGTYMIWAGSGTKNDSNATFFIKKDGTGFVKGEFFQGQLLRERSAVRNNSQTATATDHQSAGNNVKVSGSFVYSRSFSQSTKPFRTTVYWRFRRGSTVIDSGTFPMNLFYELESGIYSGSESINLNLSTIDAGTSNGSTYSYTFEVTSNLDNGYQTMRTTVDTFENLTG